MKQEPTKVQVLDALQTHKTVQKAAKALRISYPEMQKYLRKYGIVCNHNVKEKPVARMAITLPRACGRSLIAEWFANKLLRKGGDA